MKVKELISKLQELDPERDIWCAVQGNDFIEDFSDEPDPTIVNASIAFLYPPAKEGDYVL